MSGTEPVPPCRGLTRGPAQADELASPEGGVRTRVPADYTQRDVDRYRPSALSCTRPHLHRCVRHDPDGLEALNERDHLVLGHRLQRPTLSWDTRLNLVDAHARLAASNWNS